MDEAMLSAVSGIDGNQTWLDTIGNNIANANTTGFKQDSVTFDDLLAQQVEGASAPNGVGLGGVNGIDVGTGVQVAAITPDETTGTLEQTGDPTDVFINGNGYLISNYQGTNLYTQDGTMTVDANGNLVTPTGGLIQGWQASATGDITTSNPPGTITIPNGLEIAPQNTGTATVTDPDAGIMMGGNLPSNQAVGTVETSTVDAYDTQGNPITLTYTYTYQGVTGATNTEPQWEFTVTGEDAATPGTPQTFAQGMLDFTTSGTLDVTNSITDSNTLGMATGETVGTGPTGGFMVNVVPQAQAVAGSAFNAFTIQFPATTAGQDNVTQYDTGDSLQAISQDGYASGTLASLSIGTTGIITGTFSNGHSLSLGQLALANFANPEGLEQVGDNNWAETPNSGIPLVDVPGTGAAGTVTGGALESSNVDMGTQLTNLVIAQTSYQANTRVVTTEATDLTTLIQMG